MNGISSRHNREWTSRADDPADPSLELYGLCAGLAVLWFLPELPAVPLCPIYSFLGLDCPTCGTVRGVWLLIHGRTSAAWLSNPISFVVIAAVARRLLSSSFESRVDGRLFELTGRLLLVAFFAGGWFHWWTQSAA